jgi:uncharacterized protein YjdB
MATYQVAYNPTTKFVKIQPVGTALGAGFSNKGTFVHGDGEEDTPVVDAGYLGDDHSHVFYQHVQDLLYKAGVQDMASVKITIPAVTISTLPATKTLDLSLGETQILANTITPAFARVGVTYTTSDATKVTVDADGKITPVAVGSATITATANPGGATDTCVVTVQA